MGQSINSIGYRSGISLLWRFLIISSHKFEYFQSLGLAFFVFFNYIVYFFGRKYFNEFYNRGFVYSHFCLFQEVNNYTVHIYLYDKYFGKVSKQLGNIMRGALKKNKIFPYVNIFSDDLTDRMRQLRPLTDYDKFRMSEEECRNYEKRRKFGHKLKFRVIGLFDFFQFLIFKGMKNKRYSLMFFKYFSLFFGLGRSKFKFPRFFNSVKFVRFFSRYLYNIIKIFGFNFFMKARYVDWTFLKICSFLRKRYYIRLRSRLIEKRNHRKVLLSFSDNVYKKEVSLVKKNFKGSKQKKKKFDIISKRGKNKYGLKPYFRFGSKISKRLIFKGNFLTQESRTKIFFIRLFSRFLKKRRWGLKKNIRKFEKQRKFYRYKNILRRRRNRSHFGKWRNNLSKNNESTKKYFSKEFVQILKNLLDKADNKGGTDNSKKNLGVFKGTQISDLSRSVLGVPNIINNLNVNSKKSFGKKSSFENNIKSKNEKVKGRDKKLNDNDKRFIFYVNNSDIGPLLEIESKFTLLRLYKRVIIYFFIDPAYVSIPLHLRSSNFYFNTSDFIERVSIILKWGKDKFFKELEEKFAKKRFKRFDKVIRDFNFIKYVKNSFFYNFNVLFGDDLLGLTKDSFFSKSHVSFILLYFYRYVPFFYRKVRFFNFFLIENPTYVGENRNFLFLSMYEYLIFFNELFLSGQFIDVLKLFYVIIWYFASFRYKPQKHVLENISFKEQELFFSYLNKLFCKIRFFLNSSLRVFKVVYSRLIFVLKVSFFRWFMDKYISKFRRIFYSVFLKKLVSILRVKLNRVLRVGHSTRTKLIIHPLSGRTMTPEVLLTYFKIKLNKKFTFKGLIYPFINRFRYSKKRGYYLRGFYVKGAGRFTRRQRSSTFKIFYGKINFSTIKAHLAYSYINVITRYGTCGVSLWMNYNKKFIRVFKSQVSLISKFKF